MQFLREIYIEETMPQLIYYSNEGCVAKSHFPLNSTGFRVIYSFARGFSYFPWARKCHTTMAEFHFAKWIMDKSKLTGYYFWDRLRNYLHKSTWIVLSIHKLNKLGKFWLIYGQLLNIMSSYGWYEKSLRRSQNY